MPAIILLFVLLTKTAFAVPPLGNFVFDPEFSDEFSGPSLDLNIWDNWTPHTTEHSIGRSSPNNTELRDGFAYLWIRKEEKGYTTPWLSSKKQLLYGYIEIRAKLAYSLANQNLWLYRWTENGSREIDVFEIAPAFKGHERTIFTNIHIYDGPAELENENTRRSHSKPIHLPDFDPTQFNIYGLAWTPEVIIWYLNGKPIRTEKNVAFHWPMKIITGAGIHPNWFGVPTSEMIKSPMIIDYLRTWRWVGH